MRSEQVRRGRRRAAASSALAAAVLVTGTMSAVGDDPRDQKKTVDGKITTAQRDFDTVSRDLTAAVNALQVTNGRVTRARSHLTRTEGDLRRATGAANTAANRLRTARADEKKNSNKLGRINNDSRRTRTLVGGIARHSYMQGGLGQLQLTLDVITQPGGGRTADNLGLADIVLRQQNGVLNRLNGQKASGRATANRLGSIRSSLSGLKTRADTAARTARTARDRASRAKTSLEGLQRSQRQAASTLRTRKSNELRELNRLKRESRRLGGVLVARANARKRTPTPPVVVTKPDGHFLTAPRPKSTSVSGFGYRLHPVLHIWKLHEGMDFALACGTPVYASAPGTIVQASFDPGAGNNAVIDHGHVEGRDLATQYMHLSAFKVRSGTVKRGQLIGLVGTTGRSTGCHLHFAVLSNGTYVNPASFIG